MEVGKFRKIEEINNKRNELNKLIEDRFVIPFSSIDSISQKIINRERSLKDKYEGFYQLIRVEHYFYIYYGKGRTKNGNEDIFIKNTSVTKALSFLINNPNIGNYELPNDIQMIREISNFIDEVRKEIREIEESNNSDLISNSLREISKKWKRRKIEIIIQIAKQK